MIKIFRDADTQAGFNLLREDFFAISQAFSETNSRLCDKGLNNIMDEIHDEMLTLLTDECREEIDKLIEANEDIGDVMDAVAYIEWVNSVPHYLIEAYEGYYEDEMAKDLTVPMEEPEHVRAWVLTKLYGHTPKERLEIYLHWNGILGWTEQILKVLG